MKSVIEQMDAQLGDLLKPEINSDYLRLRELTPPCTTFLPKYSLRRDLNGYLCAVFEDANAAYEFELLNPGFRDCPVTCFGGHLNAFVLFGQTYLH